MNTTRRDGQRPEGTRGDAEFPLVAVMLYDEAQSGRRAMRALNAVHDAEDACPPLDVRLWRLDILAAQAMRQAAAADVAAADVVLLSVNHEDRLPPGFCEWLAGTFGRRPRSGAAGRTQGQRPAPFPSAGSRPPTGTDTIKALEQSARDAGIDLLVLCAARNPFQPGYSLESIRHRAEQVTPLLDEILQWPEAQATRPRRNQP